MKNRKLPDSEISLSALLDSGQLEWQLFRLRMCLLDSPDAPFQGLLRVVRQLDVEGPDHEEQYLVDPGGFCHVRAPLSRRPTSRAFRGLRHRCRVSSSTPPHS
jgi:hypothetical protein